MNEKEEKPIGTRLKEEMEKMMKSILDKGIKSEDITTLYKMIDIHKDIENEEYWKEKEENMRYMYGRDSYGDDSYGRRRRDSRGRYMEGEAYGRRGVPGTGRGYRGEDMIDEMSYLTFNRHQSELLFKVIADRSERKSIIVSTNLAFSEWLTMFENQTMVAAMIDRLTYRSFVLNMNSDRPYRAEFAAQSDISIGG